MIGIVILFVFLLYGAGKAVFFVYFTNISMKWGIQATYWGRFPSLWWLMDLLHSAEDREVIAGLRIALGIRIVVTLSSLVLIALLIYAAFE